MFSRCSTIVLGLLVLGTSCDREPNPVVVPSTLSEPPKLDLTELGRSAFSVFSEHCGPCHHTQLQVADFDILDLNSLLKDRPGGAYVVAGKLDESRLWSYMSGPNPLMPITDDPDIVVEPTNETDRKLVSRWIQKGAPNRKTAEAEPIPTLPTRLQSIGLFLDQQPIRDWGSWRFFDFSPVFAQKSLSNDHRTLYAPSLAKIVNSVHWKEEIEQLRSVAKTNGTVWAIRIDELEWPPEAWQGVLASYPYGFHPSGDQLAEDSWGRSQAQNKLRSPRSAGGLVRASDSKTSSLRAIVVFAGFSHGAGETAKGRSGQI